MQKIDPSATDEQARMMLAGAAGGAAEDDRPSRDAGGAGVCACCCEKRTEDQAADPSAALPPMPSYMRVPVTELQGRTIGVNADGRGVWAVVGRGGPISELADQLSNVMKTPVMDRTGLIGKYYFGLKFQNPAYQISTSGEEYTPAPDLSSALPDQLGLKLGKAKVPAEYLVVEHWEQPAA